jgi:hypothetical protein
MLEIIKTLFSRGDLNSGSLHTTVNKIPRPLKVKIQWREALYRETVAMLLQINSELALSDPRYSGDCYTVKYSVGTSGRPCRPN